MKTDMPNRKQIILKLNEILEHELAGVARYTHYSFMSSLQSHPGGELVSQCRQ